MAGNKKSPEKRRLYAVYDARTDELLAFGNSDQCAALLGYKNEGCFRKIVWMVNTGKNKKYSIVVMNGYGDDDE